MRNQPSLVVSTEYISMATIEKINKETGLGGYFKLAQKRGCCSL